MNTAAALPGPEVERQEAEAAQAMSASESTSSSRSSWTVTASIAKNVAAISASVAGEAVHVVEQVERVRHPDEPEDADRRGEHVVADDLDREPVDEHDRRGAELRAQLEPGGQGVDVVDEAGDEEHAAPPRTPSSSSCAWTPPTAIAAPIPAASPRKMPTPPKVGVACALQRSPAGVRDQPAADG